MPSPLTLLTFSLNQLLTDFLLPFPIRWNSTIRHWEVANDNPKERRYYVTATFAAIFWLLSCLSVITISYNNAKLHQASELLMTAVQMVVCVASLVFEFITYAHIQTIIEALNLFDVLEKDGWFQTNITCYIKKGLLEKLSRSFCDLTGAVIFTLYVYSTTVLGTIMTLGILCNYWDPIYFLMINWELVRYVDSLPVVIFRFAAVIWISNVSIISILYSIIIYVYSGLTGYHIVNSILKVNPKLSNSCLMFFRQATILVNLFIPVLVPVTGCFLEFLGCWFLE